LVDRVAEKDDKEQADNYQQSGSQPQGHAPLHDPPLHRSPLLMTRPCRSVRIISQKRGATSRSASLFVAASAAERPSSAAAGAVKTLNPEKRVTPRRPLVG